MKTWAMKTCLQDVYGLVYSLDLSLKQYPERASDCWHKKDHMSSTAPQDNCNNRPVTLAMCLAKAK